MSKEDITLANAVTKLIDLTRSGALKWLREEPPESLLTDKDENVHIVFYTKYKNRYLRLYEKQVRDYEGYLEKRVVLELVDKRRISEWEFPYYSEINELMEAVKYQTSNVDIFLKEIFDET